MRERERERDRERDEREREMRERERERERETVGFVTKRKASPPMVYSSSTLQIWPPRLAFPAFERGGGVRVRALRESSSTACISILVGHLSVWCDALFLHPERRCREGTTKLAAVRN